MHLAERRAFTINIIKSKSELLLGCICGKFTFLFLLMLDFWPRYFTQSLVHSKLQAYNMAAIALVLIIDQSLFAHVSVILPSPPKKYLFSLKNLLVVINTKKKMF